MRAVAIDFETANEQRASPCSIGLAWIADGVIESVEHHYIRPPGMRFASFNVAFHGIGPDHVRDADEFPAILARLAPRLRGRVVLAHNAAFDISVVRNTCDVYGLPYPEFDYLCTVKLARQSWPELTSGKLNDVCAHLGIKFKHHDASEDAYACAALALEAMKATGATCFNSLSALTNVTVGRLNSDSYWPCSSPAPRVVRQTPAFAEGRRAWTPPASSLAFSGMTFVFTGVLERFTRAEAQSLTESVGGHVSGSVSKTTDYVVAGPGAGARLKSAEKHGVQVLTEDEWLALIGA